MSSPSTPDPTPPPAAAATTSPRELELLERNAQSQERFWELFEWVRKKVTTGLIWAAFFGLFWLLRDFFALIFLTFVLSFLGTTGVVAMRRFAPSMSWKSRTIIVFSGAGILMLGVGWLMAPQAAQGVLQFKAALEEMPQQWEQDIDPWLYENIGPYQELVTIPEGAPAELGEPGTRRELWEVDQVRSFLAETRESGLALMPRVLTDVATGVSAVATMLFLAILFSFLIVSDLAGLTAEVKKLEQTRLSEFYRGVARDIVRFGEVLGKVLEAQAVISFINTILTAIGIWIFGLPGLVFLSILVFACGFVPVAGVFISSVPLCLVALSDGGVPELLMMIGFITGIHFLEAYVLNPRIMGAKLKINPVMVLVILVIGHHAGGVWGLLLGLPVVFYFFTHVIKHEDPDIGLRAKYAPGTSQPEPPKA